MVERKRFTRFCEMLGLDASNFRHLKRARAFFVVLAVAGIVSACADTSSTAPSSAMDVSVTVLTRSGGISTSSVTASVVESEGVVYVDAVVPQLSADAIRFQIEEPIVPFVVSPTRSVGAKLREDTGGVSIRIKATVNTYPSELAFLGSTSGDTLAVFRTIPIVSGSVVKTNFHSVRLADGTSISISVDRPFATISKHPTREAFASVTPAGTFALKCATRVFSLLAPPMLSAQSQPCPTERRALRTAAATQAATFALAGPASVASLGSIIQGAAMSAIIPGSGAWNIFGGVVGLGATALGMVTTSWGYSDAVANLRDCEVGAGIGVKRKTRLGQP
jgi:hypothetical protein